MTEILNIGCGNKIIKTGYNLDKIKKPGVDYVHDLNKYPYPIKTETFDVIYAHQILDHVQDFRETMKELHRILKPNGILNITINHFSGREAYHPDHNMICASSFANQVCLGEHPNNTANDSLNLFRRYRIRIRLYKGKRILGYILEPIINLFPIYYESSFLRSLFPANLIEAELIKV